MLANHELLVALLRTTLFSSAAVTLALFISRSLRSTAPRFQRAAWALAIAQAWLLIPYTFRVEVEEAAPAPVVMTTNVVVSSAPLTLDTPLLPEPKANTEWLTTSNLAKAIAAIWIAGAAIMVLSAAYRYAKFMRHLSRDAVAKTSVVISLREMDSCSRSEQPTLSQVPPDEREWQTEWQNCLSAKKSRRRVPLRMTEGLGPLVYFIPFYYLLLAPRQLWQTLSHPERRAILQHELAHLERGDVWKSLLIRLLALPQWFNPLVWLAVRRFDEAGEWACDDRVAQSSRSSQLHLAKSLIHAAEYITAAAPASASAQGGVLSRRIRRLVTPQIQEGSNMKKGFLCVTLVALAAVQAIRIDRVSAAFDDTPNSPESDLPIVHGAMIRRDEPQPQPPAVVAQEREDGQMVPMQMVAAENGATVATAMSQVKRWLTPAELAKSPIVLRRRNKDGDTEKYQESKIVWDAEINSPTPETNYLLQPSDLILLLPRHAIVKNAEATEASPPIVVQLNGSRGQAVPAALMNENKPVTVDRAICSVSWPHPMSFSKATISVPCRNENGTETVLPVAWQGSMPTEETNHVLQAGDRVVVRDPNFAVASTTSAVIQSTATIPPAPAANLPPGTTAIHCKAMLVRVKSGSLHEFDESQKKSDGGLDAATMVTTLRVLQNNKLIEMLSRPECIAAVGEKSRIEVSTKPTGDGSLRDGFVLELTGRPSEKGVMLQVSGQVYENGPRVQVETIFDVAKGKSALLKFVLKRDLQRLNVNAPASGDEPHDVYVLLTPTIIRSGEKPPAAN